MSVIYEIKASLEGSSPSIFRAIRIPAFFSLSLLHEVFQAAFAWENFHRHFFKSTGGDLIKNEDEITLHDLLGSNKGITYLYDLGNSWTLHVERISEWNDDDHQKYPLCIGGDRKSPPEDSGGIVGYQMALEMLREKDPRDIFLLFDWYGDSFNPEDFDLDEVNRKLDPLRFIKKGQSKPMK